jgi:hypothetical protein
MAGHEDLSIVPGEEEKLGRALAERASRCASYQIKAFAMLRHKIQDCRPEEEPCAR